MESERELGRVNGLGSGKTLGFSLIVTDRRLLGINTRKFSSRLWLSITLGLALGLILVVSLVSSGLESALFRLSPLLSFVTLLALVLCLPIGMVVLVPRLLRGRLSQTGYSTISLPRKDIIRIEVRRPGKINQKGYFTVNTMNSELFTFWTLGQDMFDQVNSLLTKFAPGQLGAPTGDFTDLHKPRNQLIAFIVVLLIILIGVSGASLSGSISSSDFEELLIGTVVLHILATLGYLGLRRARHRLRRKHSSN